MNVKRLATYGRRGALVRVNETVDGTGIKRYVVQWGSKAKREQQSYPGTPKGRKEAMAFAEGFAEEAAKPAKAPEPEIITTRDLFERYMVAVSPTLRPRTIKLYRENWMHWQEWFKPETPANAMTADTAHEFRAALETTGLSTKYCKTIVDTVRGVYRYAEATEKITRNRWHQFVFKVAKDKRTQPRAEYRQHEFLSIWKQFDPTRGDQWRGYVAIGLLGLYGMRQSATLRLTWEDVGADVLTFRPEWDKQGETHRLPVLPLTLELLAVAHAWRERKGYNGPWLLFSGRVGNDGPYSMQSLWSALEHAEARAGIAKIRWRAGHGFRRGLVGDLLEAGNDMELALKAIGDRDLTMARHYAIKRDDRINRALSARADSFGLTEGATKGQASAVNDESASIGDDASASVTLNPATT